MKLNEFWNNIEKELEKKTLKGKGKEDAKIAVKLLNKIKEGYEIDNLSGIEKIIDRMIDLEGKMNES